VISAATTITVSAATTITVSAATATATLRGQLSGDQRAIIARAEQFQKLRLLTGRLGGEDLCYQQAIEVGFGLDLHHIADRDTIWDQRSVEVSLRLPRTNRAPSPTAVTPVRGEFYFKPASHGQKRYMLDRPS